MTIKERILFVAIGQGGGNITTSFDQRNYNCLFLNTSNDDLESISGKHKYHVPGAYGCSKEKKKALEYAQGYYESMIRVIEQTFPRQDIINFIFTGGGGTGAGLGPILLDILSSKNTNKRYNAVFVLPSLSEPKQALENAVETYQEILKIEDLNNLIILDNNKNDRFMINSQFFMHYDRLVNATEKHKNGIIDPAEIETIITAKGTTYMIDIPGNMDRSWQIEQAFKTAIYADFEKGCKYIAFIKNKNIDMQFVESRVGVPMDRFEGYTSDNGLIAIAGMPYPISPIQKIIEKIESLNNQTKDLDNRSEINFSIHRKNEIHKINTTETTDVTNIFKKYMK